MDRARGINHRRRPTSTEFPSSCTPFVSKAPGASPSRDRPRVLRVPLRPKILAVDDDPTNLAIIEELLGDDYDVTMLSDARTALDTAKQLKPSLVLLDIMMP